MNRHERQQAMAAIDRRLLRLDELMPRHARGKRTQEARKEIDDLAWDIEKVRSSFLNETPHSRIEVNR